MWTVRYDQHLFLRFQSFTDLKGNLCSSKIEFRYPALEQGGT